MKRYFLLFIFFSFTVLFAQQNKGRWNDLFSYSNVKFIENVQGILYCATENGIFLFNPQNPNAEWIKYNKTNVLSNVNISALDYDPSQNILMIGYENGTIDLLKDGESSLVLDIPWNNFMGSKKINDIFIHDNIAIISGNFGITSYSLTQREFLETTFFYSNGDYKAVNKAVVFDGKIYAATNTGLYRYPLVEGTNYPNFFAWELIQGTANVFVSQLEVFDHNLYYTFWDDLYKRTSADQVSYIANYPYLLKIKTTENNLVVTQANQINFIDQNNQSVIKKIQYRTEDSSNLLMEFNTGFFYQNKYYGGSKKFGLIDFDLTSVYQNNPEGYKPDGPYNNLSWSVTAMNDKVWVTPGGAIYYNEPKGNADGFYFFDKFKWKHFKSPELLDAKDFFRIAVNPKNDNHFVAVPYFEATNWSYTNHIGVMEIKMNGDSFTFSHILSPLYWLTRSASASFDNDGNLYLGTSLPEINGAINGYANYYYERKGTTWKKSLVYKNGLSNALSPVFSNKYIWYPNARAGGLSVLDKNMNEVVTLTKSNADLYDDGVLSTAVDQNNTVWIGTQLGLTILSGADNAIDDLDYKTKPIVIIQDGIPEALLTSVAINDIEVDKANRKWVATNSSGAYYFSDNGERTIFHFTSKNSPLPSDIVYDIAIDDKTGKVYFATDKGTVAFNGDVQEIGDKFDKVIAYPNPVRPGFKGNVIIKNIPTNGLIKITDVTGNLIYESKSNGGIVEWDTKNSKGIDVASGIYLVLMTNRDGTETKTIKIAVVR